MVVEGREIESYVLEYLSFFSQLYHAQSRLLTTLMRESFENIFGEGENAGNWHFLLLQKCFLSFSKRI